MLQLITGRSGSGKTTAVFRELAHRAAENVPLFLLVPEQASFEAERQLLTELGPKSAQRVCVVSFSRLPDVVFREVGGLTGRRMDTTLSLLLISQALHSVQDSLTVYRQHIDKPDYLRAVAGIIKECKQCAITPASMENMAASLPPGLLHDKLHDITLVFSAYDALVTQAALIDPQDDLTWLADNLANSRIFDGAHVFVDGFNGFTAQEMLVLERLLPQTSSLTVTLCTDTVVQQSGREFDRFATAIHTAAQLRDAAYRCHVKVAPLQQLTTNFRTEDPALRTLEAGCFSSAGEPFESDTNTVRVVACADRMEECRYAARLIRRLLRENGGYCRDFTVVARDITAYSDYMDNALRREGLPCCRDYREAILTQPLITLVESALAVLTENYQSNDVLRLVKTGLLGFSTVSASLLENYVLLWNIHGSQWRVPFTAHPDGLSAPENNRSHQRLRYLNILRHRLIQPLEQLSEDLSGLRTGREFAEAICRFLSASHVPRCIRLQAARLDNQGEHAAADCQARLWDYLMGVLDKFAVALPDTRLPLARLVDLFHLAVSTDDLGSLPQGLDGVILGAADRIRYAHPKTVIVLGANEGVFPAHPTVGGVLTNRERRILIDAGLPVTDNSDRQSAEERFFAYMAVAAPSERLVITYAKRQGNTALYPSTLVSAVKSLLPACHCPSATAELSESEEDAFAVMALRYREQTAEAAAYRAVFSRLPTYAEKMQAMRRLEDGFSFQNPSEARRLFGNDLMLSPSQVETFHQCRFAYFCKYGLQAQPRKTTEWNAAEAGTLAHYLMRQLLPRYCGQGWDTVTRQRIHTDVKDTVWRYVTDCFGETETADARFLALIARLTQLCQHLLWRVVRELQQSQFVPVDYELPIGSRDGEGIPAWVLPVPDGSTVQVRGIVDRVDVFRQGDNAYLRILDYKTGTRVFELSTVLEGINLQMLIYLFSLCENGQARYGHIIPSGVLYLPAKIPVIRTARNCSDEEKETAQLKTMCTNGLLLDDETVLRAMESDLKGVFIPVSFTKSGGIKSKDLVTLQQFGILKKHIQNVLTSMAVQLHNGAIDARPKADKDGNSMCKYCDYHDICGHEPADPVTIIPKLSTRDAMAVLEEGETDE